MLILVVGHYQYERYYGPFIRDEEIDAYKKRLIDEGHMEEGEESFVATLRK